MSAHVKMILQGVAGVWTSMYLVGLLIILSFGLPVSLVDLAIIITIITLCVGGLIGFFFGVASLTIGFMDFIEAQAERKQRGD